MVLSQEVRDMEFVSISSHQFLIFVYLCSKSAALVDGPKNVSYASRK